MAGYTPIVTERHVPTGLTDRQQQDMIDRAVKAERDRIVGILRAHEPPRFPNANWSWDLWRKNVIKAIGA